MYSALSSVVGSMEIYSTLDQQTDTSFILILLYAAYF